MFHSLLNRSWRTLMLHITSNAYCLRGRWSGAYLSPLMSRHLLIWRDQASGGIRHMEGSGISLSLSNNSLSVSLPLIMTSYLRSVILLAEHWMYLFKVYTLPRRAVNEFHIHRFLYLSPDHQHIIQVHVPWTSTYNSGTRPLNINI